ncbi:ras-induced vulval development antagonist-domain-containing protein [Pelagophyceae sp. CCMP2097]|nr:ras-induced vulval development antagonist-domain-containing protein [Pelagophyceae sp. CCMP2097]
MSSDSSVEAKKKSKSKKSKRADSDDEGDKKAAKKQRKAEKKAAKKAKKSKKAKAESSDSDDAAPPPPPPPPQLGSDDEREALAFKAAVQGATAADDSSDDDVGPMPLPNADVFSNNKKVSYGSALLKGEGAAIASYVQKNMRIPRRGEVGWQGDEIEKLEQSGYVMSGSRHARMNAVRIRKENQVYTAEEKRALALITFEEKQQQENKVMGEFREMLQQRLQSQGLSKDSKNEIADQDD